MPIVPTHATLRKQTSAVRLARYAQIIEYDECAFWGVFRSGQDEDQCREIWLKRQRDAVADALGEAQWEIERQIGYFLAPTWVVGDQASQPRGDYDYVDVQPLQSDLLTKWAWLIAFGVRAETTIASGSAVDHATDPATIGPVAVPAGTTIDEIAIFHPGTDFEIDPSSISLAGNMATIEVPRCRLVLASLADNPATGLDYTVLANFESTVDIKRIYNNPSTNAQIRSAQSRCSVCSNTGCSSCTQTACLRLVNGQIGHVEVQPATYSSGSWVGNRLTCCQPAHVGLYYRSGLETISWHQEQAIVRLAHTKMKEEPCGCKITQRLWMGDREIPKALTRERINCKFGLSNGAWFAWQQAMDMRLVRARASF